MNSLKDIDLLIYVPHGDTNPESLAVVESAFRGKNHISRELLLRYMIHEADIGALELARACRRSLATLSPELRVVILEVPLPRAWCDLNRPWDRAVPSILEPEFFRDHYDREIARGYEFHRCASRTLQLHTMCGRSPIKSWSLTPETTEHELREFLETVYNGDDRHIDILTHTVLWVQIADMQQSEKIAQAYLNAWHTVDFNRAYQLRDGYPATDFMWLAPSVLIEFPKSIFATLDTTDVIDNSEIVVDTEKIEVLGELLARGLSSHC